MVYRISVTNQLVHPYFRFSLTERNMLVRVCFSQAYAMARHIARPSFLKSKPESISHPRHELCFRCSQRQQHLNFTGARRRNLDGLLVQRVPVGWGRHCCVDSGKWQGLYGQVRASPRGDPNCFLTQPCQRLYLAFEYQNISFQMLQDGFLTQPFLIRIVFGFRKSENSHFK